MVRLSFPLPKDLHIMTRKQRLLAVFLIPISLQVLTAQACTPDQIEAVRSFASRPIPERIYDRWISGGASSASASMAVRIAKCESKFNPKAQSQISTAYGLFQFLNKTWAETGISKTSDPDRQIEAAFRLWKARGFQPWVCEG